ncbi:hypothetical protein MHU86_12665 [Fragilaria crotonensis]|nr:hypothetical protein MHU86_12665 [Fragilaria crotonensis]
MAFLSLYQHFLGPNNVDNMATLAEDKLKNTVYNGEQRRWDFERYVNVHKQQHSIMEGLIEHGTPESTHAPRSDSCWTASRPTSLTPSRPESCPTRGFAVTLTPALPFTRTTSDRPRSRKPLLHQGGVQRFNPDQKKELAAKRLKRGHKPGAKDSKVKGTGGSGTKQSNKDVIKNLKAVNRQVSQLAKQMGKTGVNDDDTDSSTNSGSASNNEKEKGTSNRKNPS